MTPGRLRTLAERAFKWSVLTSAGRFVLQLVAQVLLARLLGPDNYGVYGIGMVVLTFATFLSGNAFSYILMLKKEVTSHDVRFAFSWQLLAGIACALAMFVSAPLLAEFFKDPRVESMVHWMSLACVLMALGGPSICLLQRDLNFRAIGLIQMGSYAAGYLCVGLPMALADQGPQALAAACIVQAAVQLGASFALRPHSLVPLLRHPLGAETLSTGRTVFATNIINWLLTNLDRIIIGRVLNAHAVGVYSVSYNIASIPNVLLVHALQPTFLAAGARLQDRPEELARAWVTLLACVMVFLFPASIAMAMLASDLVHVLYGPAWAQAGWVMAVMFLCVPVWAALGLSTPVLWNTGRKHLEVRIQLPLLLLALPAWWLVAPYGIRAMVLAAAAVICARAAVVLAACLRALRVSPRALLPLLLRGLALGGVVALAVVAGRQAVGFLHEPLVTLVAGSLLAPLAALLLVAKRPQVLGPEAHEVVARLVPWWGGPTVATPEVQP